jgi:uncharacterized protein (TIGR02598 family)
MLLSKRYRRLSIIRPPKLASRRTANYGCFHSPGFSLIEIVIAIGIVSFCLVVVFSLLPTGLAVFQDANRQIVETEIYNTLGSELHSTPFANLSSYAQTQSTNNLGVTVSGTARYPVYFDNDGVELTGSTGAIYTAECVLSSTSSAPEVSVNNQAQRATILIGFHFDPFGTSPSGVQPDQRTFLLVNGGIGQ